MEKVNFTGALKLVTAKTNVKQSSAIEPGIDLTPTVNKFSINRLATAAMGLEAGDTICIHRNSEATSIDDKYYVSRGFEQGDGFSAMLGGDAGKGQDLDFNLNDVYSEILQNVVNGTIDAQSVSKDRLRQLGLMQGNTSLKKIYAKLESVGVTEINGEEREVYRMFDFMVLNHTPKQFSPKAE